MLVEAVELILFFIKFQISKHYVDFEVFLSNQYLHFAFLHSVKDLAKINSNIWNKEKFKYLHWTLSQD